MQFQDAAPPTFTVTAVSNGKEALRLVRQSKPDVLVTDLYIPEMGGIALCMESKLDDSVSSAPPRPVLLLLDRRADVFLARRASADGWLLKPLDPIRIAEALEAVASGASYEDPTDLPHVVRAGRKSSS